MIPLVLPENAWIIFTMQLPLNFSNAASSNGLTMCLPGTDSEYEHLGVGFHKDMCKFYNKRFCSSCSL